MMKRLITTVLFAVALQGCVTSAELTGTGPVKLSDCQQASFDKWPRGTTDQDSLYFSSFGEGEHFGCCVLKHAPFARMRPSLLGFNSANPDRAKAGANCTASTAMLSGSSISPPM